MDENKIYPGKVGLQQRVLPAYRVAFLEALAKRCVGGLSVFAGQALPVEGIEPAQGLEGAGLVWGRNRHFQDPSSSWYLCWQSGLLAWLESWQPQVLVVEANPRYPSTRQAVRWMHRRGRPVVGWGLGAPPLGQGQGLKSLLRGWERLSFLRSLDAVIAYSRRGADEYRALGLPAERVFCASNATAPRPPGPPPERPREYLGKPGVLFVGRLQARKRVDTLLMACAALPQALQPRLVIVGDGPARAEFEALAKQIYPLAEFVGAKHGADLEPFYAAADLFALPGTGGLAVQQAMAHGLPVMVAQGDGTQDDLVRPENGWQVLPDDLGALTDALCQALADPAGLRRRGAESYRIVAEEVNVEAMAGVFGEVLRAVDRG